MENQRLAQLAAYGKVKVRLGDMMTDAIVIGNQQGLIIVKDDDGIGYENINNVKLYLRSMKDLDKAIVVEGYNDNKPFYPICHIVDNHSSGGIGYIPACIEDDIVKYSYLDKDGGSIEFNIYIEECEFGNEGIIIRDYCSNVGDIDFRSTDFDLLNLWHFDYRGWIEQGLAVELREK